jgi:hypothetical protein
LSDISVPHLVDETIFIICAIVVVLAEIFKTGSRRSTIFNDVSFGLIISARVPVFVKSFQELGIPTPGAVM